jgi:molybdopterin synthase catalytic subunit
MIKVQADDFDMGRELEALTDGRTDIGGLCSFVGLVRNRNDGASVAAMTLEHYPGMTEKQLEKLEAEARRRWPLQEVLIIHRHGRLEPGDRIMMCAAASAHRQAAFEACTFLMDWLKTKAPFWKLEQDGADERWVEARTSDDDAAERWLETGG